MKQKKEETSLKTSYVHTLYYAWPMYTWVISALNSLLIINGLLRGAREWEWALKSTNRGVTRWGWRVGVVLSLWWEDGGNTYPGLIYLHNNKIVVSNFFPNLLQNRQVWVTNTYARIFFFFTETIGKYLPATLKCIFLLRKLWEANITHLEEI